MQFRKEIKCPYCNEKQTLIRDVPNMGDIKIELVKCDFQKGNLKPQGCLRQFVVKMSKADVEIKVAKIVFAEEGNSV